MEELSVKVGIKTDGEPVFYKEGDCYVLKNMLIGDGFHWQTTIEVTLPGDLIPISKLKTKFSSINEFDDKVTLINILPIETYLECVVGSEMNPDAPFEFLKAHAVISRSWLLGKIIGKPSEDKPAITENKIIGWDDTSQHKSFHVCSDDHCQRYQGIQKLSKEASTAIKETEGIVLTDKAGNLVDTRFSKCCGGITELFSTCWQDKDPHCLRSFKDPWCDLNNLSSLQKRTLLSSILKDYDLNTQNYGYQWVTEISKKEVSKNLQSRFGKNIGEVQKIEILQRGPSGRVKLIKITGSEGYVELGKELWIRRLLSSGHLYSSSFEIEDLGEVFKIKGKGWGHGVGLCQIGAANMALHDKDFKEILSFYYPGSSIVYKT